MHKLLLQVLYLDGTRPILGVNIIVKRTKTSTVSNFDGTYALVIPANSTLVFSFIGYKPYEVAVSKKNKSKWLSILK